MTINILAVIVTGIIHFGIGAIWYGLLSKQWMVALGKSKEEIMNPKHWGKTEPYIATFLCSFIITGVTAYILKLTGINTIGNAAFFGFLLWLGYVLTNLITHYSYGDKKKSLIVIDSGYFLVSFVIVSIILTLWK